MIEEGQKYKWKGREFYVDKVLENGMVRVIDLKTDEALFATPYDVRFFFERIASSAKLSVKEANKDDAPEELFEKKEADGYSTDIVVGGIYKWKDKDEEVEVIRIAPDGSTVVEMLGLMNEKRIVSDTSSFERIGKRKLSVKEAIERIEGPDVIVLTSGLSPRKQAEIDKGADLCSTCGGTGEDPYDKEKDCPDCSGSGNMIPRYEGKQAEIDKGADRHPELLMGTKMSTVDGDGLVVNIKKGKDGEGREFWVAVLKMENGEERYETLYPVKEGAVEYKPGEPRRYGDDVEVTMGQYKGEWGVIEGFNNERRLWEVKLDSGQIKWFATEMLWRHASVKSAGDQPEFFDSVEIISGTFQGARGTIHDVTSTQIGIKIWGGPEKDLIYVNPSTVKKIGKVESEWKGMGYLAMGYPVNEFELGMGWYQSWSRKHPEVKWDKSQGEVWIGKKDGEDVINFYPRLGKVTTDMELEELGY
jgi:hypothetical protein